MFFITACGNDPLDVDVSNVSVSINYVDVDRAFVHSDSVELIKNHIQFKEEINDVYSLELGQFLRIGDVDDSVFVSAIKDFRNDQYISRLEDRIEERFGDKGEIEANLTDAFKHFKFHFPSTKVPSSIVYLNTVFQASAAATENEIGIGLERYLGDSTDVIQELPSQDFYAWIKEAMSEEFLERDAVAAWVYTHVIDAPEGGTLAENIIYWGKVLYAVEACFPDDPKEVIVRYSKEDYNWAVENEFAFWDYLVKEKLLFKIDERVRMNMLSEGPFTPGLPEKGPDRLGQFLGWQMVRNYNLEHNLKLEELMNVSYNEILQSYEIKD